MLMTNPEVTMLREAECYCRRSVEPSQSPDSPDLAFYAPKGMSESEFDALIADDSNYAQVRVRPDFDVCE